MRQSDKHKCVDDMMVEYIKCTVVLLFVISTVLCENCVTYDFASNFNNSFNHGNAICNGMASWSLGQYSELSVDSPHSDSESFITPSDVLSCVSSYTFEMRSTGVLEVLVYMEAVSKNDQIIILANEMRSTFDDAVTGTFLLTPLSNSYVNGWQVLRIDLFGTSNFNGYITFLGVSTPGSTVIIDSFRYIPPNFENECFLYDESFTLPTTPEPVIPDPGDCVTYDFEENFNDLFNSNRGLCTGFSEWSLQEYASIAMDSPIADSHQLIFPNEDISCVSSFPFNIDAGGALEVNVYMESKSDTDQIAILANQILDDNNDAVTGSVVLTPLHDEYTDGWQTLRIELSGDNSYSGYISFLGMAAAESTVLIDSFRYIPPKLEKEKCNIYEDELFQTTTPEPTTTSSPTGQECITYNFETDFDNSFDLNNQLCSGYSAWNLGNYYSLGIENIYAESNTFISPNESSSCISSFVFEMKPEGVVEVNVYMKSVSDLDYIIVLAKKLIPNGIDTVAGFELYYATNADFVEGWNVLKVSVLDFAAFNGYITLIGSMAEDSIVLIDSFRYIPPNSEQPCMIY